MTLENTKDWLHDEIIDTKESEIIEENIYIDEDFIKNKYLIRMDLNLIQYPIFSKNTKRKENQIVKYFFNKNKDTFITVIPSAGNYIPGETEEKVFIALMKIMKQRGMPRKFIVTSKELKEELNLNTGRYIAIVKDALLRLSSTTYNFKNTMYSSEKKTILSEEIQTSIMSLKILKLGDKTNIKIQEKINDNRIKEVYEICISDHFYNNVVTKGYLVYDSDVLLSIDTSTARKIYMLIEKLRYHEVYLKIDTLFLIKRIPLKYSKSHMSRTIKILESNLQSLKDKNLIESFNFIKESTWEKSEIEIYFTEEIINEKQERFFGDLNDFKKISTSLAISDTEHDLLVVSNEEEHPFEVTKEMIENICNVLPTVAKKLKSMPKTIADNIERYGFEKVMKAGIYLSNQKNLKSPRAYFLKVLENGWADELTIKNQVLKENQDSSTDNFQNNDIKDYSKIENFYNSLSSKEQEEIENKAYVEYIKKCGQETKIQQLAFKAGKKQIIYKYIEVHADKYLNQKNIYIEEAQIIRSENDIKVKTPIENKSDEVLTDIVKFNEYIDKNIEIYKIGLKLSEDEVLRIKKNILMELTLKFMTDELSLKDINNSIINNLK